MLLYIARYFLCVLGVVKAGHTQLVIPLTSKLDSKMRRSEVNSKSTMYRKRNHMIIFRENQFKVVDDIGILVINAEQN